MVWQRVEEESRAPILFGGVGRPCEEGDTSSTKSQSKTDLLIVQTIVGLASRIIQRTEPCFHDAI